MAMLGNRDRPTYYTVVDTVTGETLDRVSKSKAMQRRAELQKTTVHPLELKLES